MPKRLSLGSRLAVLETRLTLSEVIWLISSSPLEGAFGVPAMMGKASTMFPASEFVLRGVGTVASFSPSSGERSVPNSAARSEPRVSILGASGGVGAGTMSDRPSPDLHKTGATGVSSSGCSSIVSG
jgi:hypothetical protein